MVLHLRVQANLRGRCSIHEEQNRGDEGGRMRVDSHGANLVASDAKQGYGKEQDVNTDLASRPVRRKILVDEGAKCRQLTSGRPTRSERVGIILVDRGCTAIHCTDLF